MSPNPPDASRPLFVGDDDAYRAQFDELMTEAKRVAAREGRPLDSQDINAAASEAAEFSRHTEFSTVATAWIQGDRAPAEECCERVREAHGHGAADALMKRLEKAVRDKLALIEGNRAALRSRNHPRR
jgi:hypothetical protein